MDATKSVGRKRTERGQGAGARQRSTVAAHEARRSGGRASVTVDERRRMIASLAYFHAERRGFAPGGELDDWLAAEREIDMLLRTHATPAD